MSKLEIHGGNEGPSKSLTALDLQCAIVDGINSYMRYLRDNRWIEHTSDEEDWDGLGTGPMKMKYEIATGLALSWTTGESD